jgi:hypothetical protein
MAGLHDTQVSADKFMVLASEPNTRPHHSNKKECALNILLTVMKYVFIVKYSPMAGHGGRAA